MCSKNHSDQKISKKKLFLNKQFYSFSKNDMLFSFFETNKEEIAKNLDKRKITTMCYHRRSPSRPPPQACLPPSLVSRCVSGDIFKLKTRSLACNLYDQDINSLLRVRFQRCKLIISCNLILAFPITKTGFLNL
ncbi:hypothetical protein BpHYR1_018449 [Brachionus plicatilis]|uniref:Uncharacterized protein n=1 Tax=Brachionus plicatilis TaxID=10195 RepID=A0A3M7PQF7_BRAPC|nr:hypothetical protein BpHYR1_018449 [Brachionus plicatilis]